MRRRLWVGLALLTSLATKAAVQVPDRFDADIVPVQITQELAASQRQALEQVLVKLTGNAAVLADEAIEKALSRAPNYVVQYGYYQADGQERFRASFNPSQLEALLARAEQPVWGALRPQVLVWIAQEQARGRRLLGDSDSSDLIRQIKATASDRGLPLTVPLMDLDDSMAISSADVWGSFISNLQPASRRYGADFVVIAKVIPQRPQGERLVWQLWSREMADNGVLARGELSGSEAELAQQMVNQIADHLGSRYAMKSDQHTQERQQLIVKGVEQVADVVYLKQLLRQLPVVASSALTRVDGSQLTFDLTLLGAVEEFQKALVLEQRLQAMAPPPGGDTPAVVLPSADDTTPTPDAVPTEAPIQRLYYQWRAPG